MTFANRLKQLRKENGYTQATLAEALGVSKGTVAMWETGKRTPDYEVINQMSDIFDRRIDYILGYSDDTKSPKLTEDEIEQLCEWVMQNDTIDIFRAYLTLDEYGKSSVDDHIRREVIRCKGQNTSVDISNIKVGLLYEKQL